MELLKRLLQGVDSFQQRHAFLGFPLAVVKKFGDDQAGNLAALIAYYGFFSLFPLLLLLVTLLGFFLRNDPQFQQRVLDSALAQFPILGDQLKQNVHSVRGSGVGLIVGLAGTLYGGLGVARAAQNALNEVWEVPMVHRPNFFLSLLRSLLLLLVVGLFMICTTVLTGIGSGGGTFGAGLRMLAIGASTLVNVAVFALAFRVLTAREIRWRDLLPGAVVAAVSWQVLQAVGSYYVGHQLKNASQVYGFFAVVIGLLSWLYLEAQVLLFAAEVNVVKAGGLWPRSLLQPPLTPADRVAYEQYAEVEERRPEEEVDVDFERAAVNHGRDAALSRSGAPRPGMPKMKREAASDGEDGARK